MATTEDDDVNVGEGSGVAEQDYFRIVSVLQSRLGDATAGAGDGASALTAVLEIAAQEFSIERGNQCVTMMEFLELGEIPVRIESEERRCTHSCSGHDEPMNPNLWGHLPPGVLTTVFAHLPVAEISNLKMLNKEWRQTVSSAYFRRVCSEVYPKMALCLITRIRNNMFWVRVLDHLRQKWHTYQIRVPSPVERIRLYGDAHLFAACEDQGLVCFVTQCPSSPSWRKEEPPTYYFTVVNPLTASHKELRPLSQWAGMMLLRIHVDGTTKAFKVFALARRLVCTEEGVWGFAGAAKHEYDSRSGEWITTDGSDGFDPDRAGRLAYDFENGRLFAQDIYGSVRHLGMSATALSKGRLFVLQLGSDGPANRETANQSPMFYIEEFHWQRVNWVKVDSHRCDPFERRPKLIMLTWMDLHACDGFLMVIMDGDFRDNERFRVHLAWLYDLSTRKWITLDQLPVLPASRRTHDHIDRMMQAGLPPHGGWRFTGEICDKTYHISMMLEPKWVT